MIPLLLQRQGPQRDTTDHHIHRNSKPRKTHHGPNSKLGNDDKEETIEKTWPRAKPNEKCSTVVRKDITQETATQHQKKDLRTKKL